MGSRERYGYQPIPLIPLYTGSRRFVSAHSLVYVPAATIVSIEYSKSRLYTPPSISRPAWIPDIVSKVFTVFRFAEAFWRTVSILTT